MSNTSDDSHFLEVREVVAVDAVARTRSFRTAAEMLNTSQPTLSRLIASAEKRLSLSLFSRGWSGADTTPQGDVVVRTCHLIVDDIEQAESRLGDGRTGMPSLKHNLRSAQLQIIEAVTKEGSVTIAAKKLGRSQPDLSRTISDFSKRYDLDLFKRTTSGMTARPAAEILTALSGSIKFHLDQLPLQLHKLDGVVVGRVAIGMLPFSGQDLILKAFAKLTNRYPNIRLACVPGGYNALVEGLRRKEIDRIIGILRDDACPEGLTETPLYDEKFAVIARHDHALHQDAKDPKALANTNWVVAPHGTPVRSYFERVFSEIKETPPTQTCELLSFGSAEQMLLDSHSVGMLTYSARKLANLRSDLKEVRTNFPQVPAHIGMTRLTNDETNPAIVEFEKVFRQIVATTA